MDLTREKLQTAFAKILSKHRDADPLTLSEKLVERLEWIMDDAEGGYDIQPVRIVDEVNEVDEDAPRKPRTARGIRDMPDTAKAPPVPSSSLITQVDPEEYQRALEQADPRLRGREGASAAARRVVRPGGRVSNLVHTSAQLGSATSPLEYWTVEELTKTLGENTPAKIFFRPNGCGFEVEAERNVQPLIMAQGPSVVRLEYALPGASKGDDAGDRIVLPLVATKVFTLDQGQIDFALVMEEMTGQLEGMYSKVFQRGRIPEPSDLGESVMDGFNINDPNRSGPMGTDDGVSRDQAKRERGHIPDKDFVGQVMRINGAGGNRRG